MKGSMCRPDFWTSEFPPASLPRPRVSIAPWPMASVPTLARCVVEHSSFLWDVLGRIAERVLGDRSVLEESLPAPGHG